MVEGQWKEGQCEHRVLITTKDGKYYDADELSGIAIYHALQRLPLIKAKSDGHFDYVGNIRRNKIDERDRVQFTVQADNEIDAQRVRVLRRTRWQERVDEANRELAAAKDDLRKAELRGREAWAELVKLNKQWLE